MECIYIATEVSMFSSDSDYPCEGHFEAALYIMSYLKGRHNLCLTLKSRYPIIDYKSFKDNDCPYFYGNVKE